MPSQKPSKPISSDQLRETLLSAVELGDDFVLQDHCIRYREQVLANFPAWRQRSDHSSERSHAELYAAFLLRVALYFRDVGDQSLLALLTATAPDNPIERWQRLMTDARNNLDRGEPLKASVLLREVIAEASATRGSAVDYLLPRAYGYLGMAYTQTNLPAAAIEAFIHARDLCLAVGDSEGASIYSDNLTTLTE